MIKQVPGHALINDALGASLGDQPEADNLTKLAPVVGGLIGGGINFTSTRAVGAWAKKNFPAPDDAIASS